MGDDTTNERGTLVCVDFTVEGIKVSGVFAKTAAGSIVAGSVKDINLQRLGSWMPDIELSEVTAGYIVSSKEKKPFFTAALGESINLSNLPLVDKFLPKGQTLAIENLRVDYRAGAASICADLNIGGQARTPLDLQLSAPAPATESTEAALSLPSDTVAPPTASAADTIKWCTIEKTLGPLSFKRVGLRFEKAKGEQEARIFFLIDASFSMGPLTVGFAGLGAGSSLKKFRPAFTLDGLSIAYSQGGILISGALLYDRADQSFTGCATIKTPAICLAALAGYQSLDGEPSLFVFASVNSRAGLISVALGPVFLQITGICAGFGYNRLLKVPEVEQVKAFPLVSIASGDPSFGKEPLEILRKVKEYLPAAKGELFLAFGVKFTIQRLIDCFALLLVRIGKKLSLDIVGLAKIVLPPEVSTPLVQVEMAYKVSFDVDQGVVAISAVLTPASYLFTPRCRLTGGFAFRAWFSGDHAGDFVLSIGGYHPLFVVPEHYPKVPRVGFQWQISPEFDMKGGLYCALTPSMLMAGGAVQALCRVSRTVSFNIGIAAAHLTGTINASFAMAFDVLIAWKPFSYQVGFSVSIGIEVVFRGRARFLFFSKNVDCGFNLSLGARIEIWGPDFAGLAHVNWHIVSFDIAFGKQKRDPAPEVKLFDDFRKAFLPEEEHVCSLAVSDGLIREVESNGKVYRVVNPGQLRLSASSAIPSSHSNTDGKKEEAHKAFGIAPMNLQRKDVTSKLTITIENGKGTVNGSFAFEPMLKSVPAALWGDGPPEPRPERINTPHLVAGLLMGYKITPNTPKSPPPDPLAIAPLEDRVQKIEAWQAPLSLAKVDSRDTPPPDRKAEREAVLRAVGLDPSFVTFTPAQMNNYIPFAKMQVLSPEEAGNPKP